MTVNDILIRIDKDFKNTREVFIITHELDKNFMTGTYLLFMNNELMQVNPKRDWSISNLKTWRKK